MCDLFYSNFKSNIVNFHLNLIYSNVGYVLFYFGKFYFIFKSKYAMFLFIVLLFFKQLKLSKIIFFFSWKFIVYLIRITKFRWRIHNCSCKHNKKDRIARKDHSRHSVHNKKKKPTEKEDAQKERNLDQEDRSRLSGNEFTLLISFSTFSFLMY